ncbi:MAG: carboxylating nicotinate-nucleotide diphosphorylase [Polyangiaceae bacterium]
MLLRALIDPIIERALAEDLSGGDLSAEACVDPSRRARAVALAKSPLVVCGATVFLRVFELVDPTIQAKVLVEDGAEVARGTFLYELVGSARSLLMAERTALNFVQRMSGVATAARACVAAIPDGARTRITDTRKTTPGLRMLERYAVRTGGAHNHRDTLGSAVMIKDNHIVAAGGIEIAVSRARARAPHTSRIEVEVKNLEELDQAIAARADIIMLDNFDDALTARAMERLSREANRPLVESSGNITKARIATLANLGVDIISVGALTHSAPAADISLDFELVP